MRDDWLDFNVYSNMQVHWRTKKTSFKWLIAIPIKFLKGIKQRDQGTQQH